MKLKIIITTIGVLAMLALATITLPRMQPPVQAQTRTERRCGWFSNPTPSNAWLVDGAGDWTISVQGGYQAKGDWPNLVGKRWVKTNVHYGYGCACIRGSFDRSTKRVIEIKSAYSRPLSSCRKDRALRRAEPTNK